MRTRKTFLGNISFLVMAAFLLSFSLPKIAYAMDDGALEPVPQEVTAQPPAEEPVVVADSTTPTDAPAPEAVVAESPLLTEPPAPEVIVPANEVGTPTDEPVGPADEVVVIEEPAQPAPELLVVVEEPAVVTPSEPQAPAAEIPAPETVVEEPQTPVEVMEALPEDVTLVVVDENGDTLSLASAEASEVFTAPDPYYVFGTITYRFMTDCSSFLPNTATSVCAESLTPIQTAINSITAIQYPSNGTLYIESGTYVEDVVINGINSTGFTQLIGVNLTGTPTIKSLTVENMINFLVNGFVFTDFIYMANNTGNVTLENISIINSAIDKSINIDETGGDVSLDNVSVQDTHTGHENTSTGTGISINNTTGNVLISDTHSDNNGPNISNNTAFEGGRGLEIINTTGTINIDAGSTFNNNTQEGIYIEKVHGSVTLETISANSNCYGTNSWYRAVFGGVTVKNNGLTYGVGSGNTLSAITILDSILDLNHSAGLWLDTVGAVILDGVEVDQNNFGYSGDIPFNQIHDATSVTIKDSHFDSNGYYNGVDTYDFDNDGSSTEIITSDTPGYGLKINWGNYSDYADINVNTPGAVNISTSTFTDNTEGGLEVDGSTKVGSDFLFHSNQITLADVTLNNPNDVAEDYSTGLYVTGVGDITLNHVHADQYGTGACLNTIGNVAINGSSTFNNNYYTGLEIFENDETLIRNVTLDRVTARGNGIYEDTVDGNGVWIDGFTGIVALTETTFEENGAAGLVIQHAATVNITDTFVNGNNLYASGWDNEYDLYDNANLIYDAHDVTITNSQFNDNGFIVDDPEWGDYQEYGYGLIIDWGDAFYNDWDCSADFGCQTVGDNYSGAAIHTPGDITVQTNSTFNNNAFGGLYINGSVWDGTAVEDYGWESAYVPYAIGTLSISDTDFNNNDFDGDWYGVGLSVDDLFANITLTDINASGNGDDGIEINDVYAENPLDDNGTYESTTGTINLETIIANYNWGGGLDISDTGAVTATDITAIENEDEGLSIDGVFSTWTQFYDYMGEYYGYEDTYSSVNLVDITTNGNYDYGLSITDTGDVTATDITTNGNAENGLRIDGVYSYDSRYDDTYDETTNFATVDLINITANENYNGSGVDISDTGAVTATDITANGNEYDGLNIDGVYSNYFYNGDTDEGITSYATVDLTDFTANENYCNGINLYDVGSVILAGITATGNGWSDGCAGAYIEEAYGDISVSDSSFTHNSSVGLRVYYADGSVTIDSVDFSDNGRYDGDESGEAFGFYLYEVGDVDLLSITANHNTGDGLSVYSDGMVDGEDVTANENDWNGAYLFSGSGSVEVTDSDFNENGNDGLVIGTDSESSDTLPSIFLSKVTSNENGGNGFCYSGPSEVVRSKFSSADIVIENSTLNDNEGNGIYITNDRGSTTLRCVTTLRNNSAGVGENYIMPAAVKVLCSVVEAGEVIEGGNEVVGKGYMQGIGDGNPVSFNCNDYSGLQLTLPLGDFVKIPCASGGSTGSYSGSVLNLVESGLPAAPAGTFLSAFQVTLGAGQSSGSFLVAFKLAEGVESTEGYSILFWDGAKWVEVSGSQVGGYFQGWADQPGIYVLVKN